MNYIRHGLQEMGFNSDINPEKGIYVSEQGVLGTLTLIKFKKYAGELLEKEYSFNKIKRHINPKNNCRSYIIKDCEGNIYEVLQNDIYELGVNAPATLIREVIEE